MILYMTLNALSQTRCYKIVQIHTCNDVDHDCVDVLQAEEQLRLVEQQRREVEERQRQEEQQKKLLAKEQEVILNKKNARPKVAFSFGGRV